MKFDKILFCSVVLFFAAATQAAEESPSDACGGLTGREASMCKIHNTAHANCVAKGISTMELFAACIKGEVEEILSKRAQKTKTE